MTTVGCGCMSVGSARICLTLLLRETNTEERPMVKKKQFALFVRNQLDT